MLHRRFDPSLEPCDLHPCVTYYANALASKASSLSKPHKGNKMPGGMNLQNPTEHYPSRNSRDGFVIVRIRARTAYNFILLEGRELNLNERQCQTKISLVNGKKRAAAPWSYFSPQLTPSR